MMCPPCPGCGSLAVEPRLVDEKPFRVAARSAVLLRKLGHLDVAADVLSRLAAVKITNFLRGKRFGCCTCGATYDE